MLLDPSRFLRGVLCHSDRYLFVARHYDQDPRPMRMLELVMLSAM